METNRLIQFKCIVETGNLRKASELLNISHGALSKSMKVLESQLSVPLFLPEGRGIKITKEGLKIYEQSAGIIESVERLKTPDRKAVASTLRLATFEVFSTYFFSKILKEHADPDIVELYELTPGGLEAAVASEKVAFGITYEPIPTQGVQFLKVGSIAMGIFGRKAGLPFAAPIMPLKGAPSGVKGLDGWPDHLFPREIKYRVDLLESALEFAREGLCCVFIPKFLAKLQNERYLNKFHLDELPTPPNWKPIKRDVYLVLLETQTETKLSKQICKGIRQICG